MIIFSLYSNFLTIITFIFKSNFYNATLLVEKFISSIILSLRILRIFYRLKYMTTFLT